MVQRLLNLDPQVLIMGEHGGPFQNVALAWKQFERIRQKGDTKYFMDEDEQSLMRALKTPNNFAAATAGGARIEDIRHITRLFIEALGNPLRKDDVRWGFKEVVTPYTPWAIADLFPNAQIVCVVRDPVATINSMARTGWWGRNMEWLCRSWQQQFDDFRNLEVNYPSQVMLMYYERRRKSLPEIYKRLGLEWTNAHQDLLDGEHVGSDTTVGAQNPPLDADETNYVLGHCKDYPVT